MKRMWLWKIRRDRGITQAAAAEELGLSLSGYAKIEEGLRNPGVQKAKQIAKAWGFAWAKFFDEERR